ncbi:sulfite exporter TauE/SafE family protein [Pseudidiomarina sp. GXY010]|uniref:Sulfite exporter TauE/SafE family protein n=2 Tax=Pseudidiomarina TaxID=2800384 RepID=A0AB39X514_9GAMM|nr:sulfite exporter TauE/SafE family protein [Pseudidiomarina sp. GXY010]MDT7524912.1 sulfite exporter TauE/SafE family protein [Pseudidiomarina sp. GXY010]
MQIDAVAALLMGLAGAGHCLMMCGGLAGALSGNASLPRLLAYNAGRISSYTIAGAIIGAAASQIMQNMPDGLVYLRLLAAFFLLVLGLYLGGWWLGLQRLEKLGVPLWRALQPVAVKFRQAQSMPALYLAGMLWGWLPCGLVYSALSWAALSGSASQGALYMALFGLGTLPAMVAFGWFSQAVQAFLKSQGFKQLMGIIMILYAAWTAIIALRQLGILH